MTTRTSQRKPKIIPPLFTVDELSEYDRSGVEAVKFLQALSYVHETDGSALEIWRMFDGESRALAVASHSLLTQLMEKSRAIAANFLEVE